MALRLPFPAPSTPAPPPRSAGGRLWRGVRRAVAAVGLVLALAFPAAAECRGTDLLATMPAAERQALQARADAVPFARGNLWLARKGDQRITLVGTYHLDDPRHAATLAALAPAIEAAHTLLVEAGPEEMAGLKAKMAADPGLIVAPAGESLFTDLPRDEWDQLAAALKDLGLPAAVATRLRPWYVMLLLSMSACEGTLQAEGGLDNRLMAAAKDRHLPIRGLEPPETIFSVFNALDRSDQLALLKTALAERALADDGVVTMTEAYFRGESQLMWEFSLWETERLPGLPKAEAERLQALLERVVVTGRNRSWIPVIEGAAAEGPVLAAFGALHLPGPEGVLNLLAQDGWTVTPYAP